MREMTMRLSVRVPEAGGADPEIVVEGQVCDLATPLTIGQPRTVRYRMGDLAGLSAEQVTRMVKADLLPLMLEEAADAERPETVALLDLFDTLKEVDGLDVPLPAAGDMSPDGEPR